MNDTTALTPEAVAAIDWSQELQPATHQVKVKVTSTEIVDLTTGSVVAIAQPGYRFYWRHGHVHIATNELL